MPLEYDEIGEWSEIKLDIVRRYATEYSKILAAQKRLTHFYIDAFAGRGVAIARRSGEMIPGSPLNALEVPHAFRAYYFIDADGDKVEGLKKLVGTRSDVQIFVGDCNEILPARVFPKVRYEDYRRALCLLDPYGIHLNWSVVEMAGKMRSVEIFLNFSIMDMNRNVLRRDPQKVNHREAARMSLFWGDESWREIAWDTSGTLFQTPEKVVSNEMFAQAYRDRLREKAGFRFVPEPLPLRNSKGATVYYLYFASHNEKGGKIAEHIFNKHRSGGFS